MQPVPCFDFVRLRGVAKFYDLRLSPRTNVPGHMPPHLPLPTSSTRSLCDVQTCAHARTVIATVLENNSKFLRATRPRRLAPGLPPDRRARTHGSGHRPAPRHVPNTVPSDTRARSLSLQHQVHAMMCPARTTRSLMARQPHLTSLRDGTPHVSHPHPPHTTTSVALTMCASTYSATAKACLAPVGRPVGLALVTPTVRPRRITVRRRSPVPADRGI